MRRLVAALVLTVALVPPMGHAALPSGVRGVIYRGPVTPVCRVGTPCYGPAPGLVLVFARAGHVYRVRSGREGRFSIALRPGLYAVRVASAPKIGSGLTPRTVRVPASGWVRVRLTLDTGIR